METGSETSFTILINEKEQNTENKDYFNFKTEEGQYIEQILDDFDKQDDNIEIKSHVDFKIDPLRRKKFKSFSPRMINKKYLVPNVKSSKQHDETIKMINHIGYFLQSKSKSP